MKSIKEWYKKHKWLLNGIGAVIAIIQVIGNLLMDIFNNETSIYLTIVFIFCVILIIHIRNEPDYEFRLTDKGKPQFLKLKREPLFMRHEFISFLPNEETRKKAERKRWSHKKLVKKVKKYSKNP
jgi:hypothetical protein